VNDESKKDLLIQLIFGFRLRLWLPLRLCGVVECYVQFLYDFGDFSSSDVFCYSFTSEGSSGSRLVSSLVVVFSRSSLLFLRFNNIDCYSRLLKRFHSYSIFHFNLIFFPSLSSIICGEYCNAYKLFLYIGVLSAEFERVV